LQKAKGHDREIIRRQRSPQCTTDGSPVLSYGFGWFCNRGTTPGSVYHSGSNGGFSAFVFTIPALGYSGVIFCNQDGIDPEKLIEAVNHITGTGNNSLLKIDRLVSFNSTSRNFAPCSVIL
jgi:CubicO group peptidase (beta-lactamase class C family)